MVQYRRMPKRKRPYDSKFWRMTIRFPAGLQKVVEARVTAGEAKTSVGWIEKAIDEKLSRGTA